MNWKNVVHLIRVDMKSGRLLRIRKLTKYHERKFFTYLAYGCALILGLTISILAGVFYSSASAIDPSLPSLIDQTILSLFLSMPTLVLIYSFIFTMFQQIQRTGIKFSFQAPYWLPITWEEHTLASVLANLLGFPLASIIFIATAILVFSFFIGQVVFAVLTVLAICAAAFMASTITEIFRILQTRFIGAVYRSTGRAAIWVRFIGSLLFFIVFYLIYFYMVSGPGTVAFIQTVASAHSIGWFIPFVWLGMVLYSFINGLFLQSFVFLVLSVLFISGLFYLATLLNRRFGLYEPPAITISRGVYAPKAGLLGRFGFSTVELALIRKDFKAFTRRRELMTIFIMPIVIILIPLMQSFGTTETATPQASLYLFALVFLLPASTMAISLGNFIIGEEGQAVWRIYSSPITAKSLVKSKYFFIVSFSTLVLLITGTIGSVFFHPTLRALQVAFLESFFLILALGSISLSNGIEGADFTEVPRARMIRPLWGLLNFAACFIAGLAILFPFLPYVLTFIVPFFATPFFDIYQAVIISAIITVGLTLTFYKIALINARELLTRAEI
ncbi:hypothetical protein HXY32_07515 [Candidatus Bathyarchaeota archaeon]|nr:hypothetical protein [Candidatus Bathyarchaeota archaeon]